VNIIKWLFKKLVLICQTLRRSENTQAKVILPINNSKGRFVFFCPGCGDNHVINTSAKNNLPVHKLTGTLSKPTIRASVLSKGNGMENKPHCHSFVTNGQIHYLKDCTHELAGKTVPLPSL
jgi:hypothetical protein